MKKIKLFFRKKSIKIGLLILLIMVLITTPFVRDVINELRLIHLDPWDRIFERVDFYEGSSLRCPRWGDAPPCPSWDIIDEDWDVQSLRIMEYVDPADPVGFVNIQDKDVALEAGNEVLIQLQNKWEDLANYVPVTVFFNTESNQWFILYLYRPSNKEFTRLGGGALNIVIDGEDGSILKIFFS